MYPEEKIKRYDIERLYKRYCLTVQQEGTGGKVTQFTINNTNIPFVSQNTKRR